MSNESYFKIITVLAIFLGVSSASAYNFGISGQSGADGYSGTSGRSGQSITVFANGSPQYFDLRGEDGTPGEDGRYGEDAYRCRHRLVERNLLGAPGGQGGDGGHGGSGGSGGSAVVYTSDLNLLRNITIDASAGRGSYGGQPAYGGRGCLCSRYQWRVKKVETRYKSKKVCDANGKNCKVEKVPYQHEYYAQYSCRDGRNGLRGSVGRNGSNGSKGSVVVIPQAQALEPVNESTSVDISAIENTFDLSKNEWEQRRGALSLLGSGSQVSDSYRFWLGRVDKSITFKWNANERQPSHFSGKRASIALRGRDISYSLPSDVWTKLSESVQGDHKEVTINHAALESDVKNMQVIEIHGSGTDTVLEVKDSGNASHFVDTQFFLETDWDKTVGDKKDYEQWVDKAFFTRTGDTFRIAIGKLPIKSKYMENGKKLKLELTILRRIGTQKKAYVGEFKVEKKLGTNERIKIKMDDIDID